MKASHIRCELLRCVQPVIGLHVDDSGRGTYLCREHYIARRRTDDPTWRVPARFLLDSEPTP